MTSQVKIVSMNYSRSGGSPGGSDVDRQIYSLFDNSTDFNFPGPLRAGYVANYLLVLFGVIVIAATLFGNTLVVSAIIRDKKLRRVGNIFIINLAVSDLLVGIIVTPLSLVYQIKIQWPFGRHLCDFWVSVDIICCTASILNLCVISYDRYNAISQPLKYAKRRTVKRAVVCIILVWLYSIGIAIPPFLGWHLPGEFTRLDRCRVSQHLGYTLYSTIGAFFLPMVFMLYFYLRIYMVTNHRGKQWVKGPGSSCRIQHKHRGPQSQDGETPDNDVEISGCIMCRAGKSSSSATTTTTATTRERRNASSQTESTEMQSMKASPVPSSSNTTTGIVRQPTEESPFHQRSELRRQSSLFSPRGSLAFAGNDVVLEITQGRRKQTIQRRRLIRQISNTTSDSSYTSSAATTSTGCTETSFSSDSTYSGVFAHRRTSHVLQNLLAANVMAAEILQESVKGVKFMSHRRPPAVLSSDETDRELEPLKEEDSRKSSSPSTTTRKRRKRKLASLPQERRAVRTLGIVVGCFVLCWLPFFLITLISPMCQCITPLLTDLVLWLGYLNSACNPVIYTFFNEDFRRAFRKLSPCGRSMNSPIYL